MNLAHMMSTVCRTALAEKGIAGTCEVELREDQVDRKLNAAIRFEREGELCPFIVEGLITDHRDGKELAKTAALRYAEHYGAL